MLLIETKNIGTQTVLTNGIIGVGQTTRRYTKKAKNCQSALVNNGDSITLNADGIYEVTANFVFSGVDTGNVTVQAIENGEIINGTFATETITIPDAEIRTMTLHFKVLVDSNCVLGCVSTLAKNIAFANIGVGATFISVIVDAKKVV